MNAAIEFTTASAGSGKTFRLVEIVADAIEDGSARPQGIVATTFTVAAANELRERLAAKFYEAGRHQDAVLLGSGMIGTVHGICLDLLSRFSLEAGISPEVTILDDTQSQILLSRAFDTILSGDEENELYQLSARLDQIDPRANTYHFRTTIPKIVADARSNDIDPAALAAAIQGALKEIDPNSTVGVVQTYLQLLQQSARSLKNGKLTWADWNKLSTAAPGTAKANAHIAAPVQEIASRLGEHPRFHQDHEAYLSLIFQTARHLADQFGILKLESGAADFADLEKVALDPLTHSEEVRSILTDEIDLLVVDEFQDTSPIQLALFSRLADCAKRVVWVGDVKQAIYGFRGADPELIISAVAGAEKAGTLGKSWRSTPDLVHLVNELFAKPFEEHLSLPLKEVTLTPHRQPHPSASPSVRIAKVTSGEYTQKGEPKRLKNEYRHSATADAIQAFLNAGEQVIDKPSITLGKAVHAALQAFHLARWRGTDDSPETIAAAYDKAFSDLERDEGPVNFKDDTEREKVRLDGLRVVAAYLDSPEAMKEKPRAVEVLLKEDIPGLSVPLTRAMDLVEGNFTPVDFKSAAAKPDFAYAAFDHEIQLVSYQLLLEAIGETPPSLDLVFLVKTKTPQVIRVPSPPADAHRKRRVVALLENAVEGIASNRHHLTGQ